MKAFIFAWALSVMTVHSAGATVVEDSVLLTLNSTKYCVGTSWNLKVSHAAPTSTIRLIGNSIGTTWEIARWANTDVSGNFGTSGTFVADAAGKHTLSVEIAGVTSNIFPLEVVNCGWRNTGSLNTRYFESATLLATGKVLVTGAWQYPSGGEDRAELYDPTSETWSVTGKLITARSGHTTTLLGNGKVLVAGGYEGSPLSPRFLNTAELYDPETETWSVTGNLNAFHIGAIATLLPNGQVLVAAGDLASRSDVVNELYDPGTGTWRVTGTIPYSAHLYQSATLLTSGKVLLVGGIDNRESAPTLGGAALYDPATGTWRTTASPNKPRGYHTATLLHNGKVLFDGGNDVPSELYDPETETWSPAGIPNTSRVASISTLLPNGKVLHIGNLDPRDAGSCLPVGKRCSWLYDPDTRTWSDAVPFISESGYTTAALLRSGRVLAVGGSSNSAELYDGGFEVPRLTLNSTNYCTGDSWDLTVTNATPAASVRLMGVSNDASWEVAGWRTVDADGGIRVSGTIVDGTEGRQTLRVEISGVWSNAFSFTVSTCNLDLNWRGL